MTASPFSFFLLPSGEAAGVPEGCWSREQTAEIRILFRSCQMQIDKII
jgi:hypothetical protein